MSEGNLDHPDIPNVPFCIAQKRFRALSKRSREPEGESLDILRA
jgi:hypothetical protein